MANPRLLLWLAVLLVTAVRPAAARRPAPYAPPPAPPAERTRFLGAHPIAARLGGGFCFIDVPHVHPYAPDHLALYQRVGDDYLFTADPVPFGYDGPRTIYYGHHPVVVPADAGVALPRTVYCSLRGPHYHDYPPPDAPGYQRQGDVVFYVGPVDPAYAQQRPQLTQAEDVEYRPYLAQRPQVTVTPPSGWSGEVWVAPPAPVVQVNAPAAPSVQVNAPAAPSLVVGAPAAPSVQITAPAAPSLVVGAPAPPSLVVGVPAPSVVVAPPVAPSILVAPPRLHVVAPAPRLHVVAPPPPSIHIGIPAPPSVFIGVPGPPGVYVGPGHPHPGKHLGWDKHGRHR